MKNLLPKNLEAVFLDFDGVVVESADIKTFAFYELYLPYGEEIALKAKEYHKQHQGVNRSIKFREIHKKHLNYDISNKEIDELSHKFSSFVLEKILSCPLVEGIEIFLTNQQERKIPIFLFSATPHEELIYIIQERNLAFYFKHIYGAPETKTNAGKNIIERYSFNPSKVLFVGDSLSDFNASENLGTFFVGRVPEKERSPFPVGQSYISSFKELL